MSGSEPGDQAFRIVILDDNASTRSLAKLVLERHLPCQVALCSEKSALFATVSGSVPDLCLLDVSTDQDNGLSVCRELRRQPAMESVPIVFLSMYADPAKRVAALKAGGADYLDKPFYPEELVTRVRRHIELHRLRLEKQDQIAEQQALLRVLCHDLVNPIFGAHSLLALKRDTGDLDARTLDMVMQCCQSAMDVIDHVRREHRLLKDRRFRTDSVQVSDAFAECARILQLQFERKEVELAAELENDLPPLTINRVVLVHSVLNNLLTNALKFSLPGGRVSLRARRVERNGQACCIIEVQDQGIGMPPQILESLFDENAKVSRPGTAGELGTGAGMPLVRRYVEKSRGMVEIESRERHPDRSNAAGGTTVRLLFPLGPD